MDKSLRKPVAVMVALAIPVLVFALLALAMGADVRAILVPFLLAMILTGFLSFGGYRVFIRPLNVLAESVRQFINGVTTSLSKLSKSTGFFGFIYGPVHDSLVHINLVYIINGTPGQNYAYRQWFQEAMKGNVYVSKPYVSTTGELCMAVSVPVKSEKGQVIGVLAADINLSL
ncbi:PDC sensor domain-containing protein [Thermosediminibacter litoriperuensis]|uniref:Cache domain-containing protein n=1 Tax=Thermosediminibacter litoriperuensis TaxID=291989 RepID=A0A5S5ARM6_9FIRM|nr:cache domain-containing protein [Thermosediminibacter litoriperuensis]TYP53262.1 cache domain-containing protein [Thermosediminibacter litoriperuensis]